MICTVRSVHYVGTRYVQVRLTRPTQGFQIVPGQAVKVWAGSKVGHFAVTNFQNSSEFLDLLVAPTSPGGVSENPSVADVLFKSVPGQQFELSSPEGKGYPEPKSDGYLLIAGGSGVASLIPVFEWSAVSGVKCQLLYFDREGQHAYRDMIECVSGDDLRSTFWNTTRMGRPSDVFCGLGAGFIEARRLCVCGPQNLFSSVVRSLYAHGLEPHEHINKNY